MLEIWTDRRLFGSLKSRTSEHQFNGPGATSPTVMALVCFSIWPIRLEAALNVRLPVMTYSFPRAGIRGAR
ncbi:MAG: hypothetical protein M0C28_04870 [Candidatus Moduliflexus flocculans]|nr:hypothetical protein [Candidatus Moduliflexus flocculans]